MPKLVHFNLSAEGAGVVLSVRDAKGAAVTLTMHRRALGALAANANAAAQGDDDFEAEFSLRAAMTAGEKTT